MLARRFARSVRYFGPGLYGWPRPGCAQLFSNLSDRSLRIVQNREEQTFEKRGEKQAFELTNVASRISLFEKALHHLLPKNFHSSVPKSYLEYSKVYAVGTIASSAAMVLSTQSLLYAIGLGAGAIPLSAAINWVLKDGLGQMGGVLFASLVNNRFDADPKRWRIVAAISLDFAMYLEAMTPLMPVLFLPLAAIANVGKNISWLAASATRAGIHLSFAKDHNLADITAKAGSQTVVASTIGTGVGIVVSSFVGTDPLAILPCVFLLSGGHLFSMYKSLQHVTLDTLNSQRGDIFTRDYLAKCRGGESDSAGSEYMTPAMVAQEELVVGEYGKYLRDGHEEQSRIVIGMKFEEFLRTGSFEGDDVVEHVVSQLKCRGFHLDLAADRKKVGLIFADDATSKDMLQGYVTAHILYEYHALSTFAGMAPRVIVESALEKGEETIEPYLLALAECGWNVDHVFFDEKNFAKVKVLHA